MSNVPRLPSRPGRILLGGATIIGGIFAGTWFYMSTKQARKASREPGEKGALPSWEYRMRQTVEIPRAHDSAHSGSGSGTGTGSGTGFATAHQTIEQPTLPLDAPKRDPAIDRSQLGTLSPGKEAMRSEVNAQMQPVLRHDRGDGLQHTKWDPAGSRY